MRGCVNGVPGGGEFLHPLLSRRCSSCCRRPSSCRSRSSRCSPRRSGRIHRSRCGASLGGTRTPLGNVGRRGTRPLGSVRSSRARACRIASTRSLLRSRGLPRGTRAGLVRWSTLPRRRMPWASTWPSRRTMHARSTTARPRSTTARWRSSPARSRRRLRAKTGSLRLRTQRMQAQHEGAGVTMERVVRPSPAAYHPEPP
jgi:hypothetical protein